MARRHEASKTVLARVTSSRGTSRNRLRLMTSARACVHVSVKPTRSQHVELSEAADLELVEQCAASVLPRATWSVVHIDSRLSHSVAHHFVLVLNQGQKKVEIQSCTAGWTFAVVTSGRRHPCSMQSTHHCTLTTHARPATAWKYLSVRAHKSGDTFAEK